MIHFDASSHRLVLGTDVDADSAHFRLLETASSLEKAGSIWPVLGERVEEMASLVSRHNLFDVLELVRRREIPATLDGYKESEGEGIAAVVDLVALVGISSDAAASRERMPGSRESSAQISDDVDEILKIARELLHLAVSLSFPLGTDDRIAELGAAIRLQELLVRNKQYRSIADDMTSRIFTPTHIEALLDRVLGFNYQDLCTFRNATTTLYRSGLNRVSEAAARMYDVGQSANADIQALEIAARALHQAMQSPSQHTRFTVPELASASGLPVPKIQAIVDLFATGPNTGSARELVEAFLDGEDAIGGRGLIGDGHGAYAILQEPVPNDVLRRTIESRLTSDGKWNTYGKHRDAFAETYAAERIATLLGISKPTHFNLGYFTVQDDAAIDDLGRECKDLTNFGKLTEADALFVVDDIAICLEVKAGSLTARARRGEPLRVATDLKKTIGAAADQASRLKALIVENGGIWLHNKKWLDLAQVREVYTIVACLDDFGPLAIAADSLVRSGLLNARELPWIISLHDLDVAMRIFTNPATFLLYLTRRTEPEAARTFAAVDELDVMMWFVQGGFYFEADPDEVHRLHPLTPPPKSSERKAFRRRGFTQVSTTTDALDAWMYHLEGTASASDQPTRKDLPRSAQLTDFFQTNSRPGRTRAAAHFLGMAEESQEEFFNYVDTVVYRTSADAKSHTASVMVAALSGYFGFFVASEPANGPKAKIGLQLYMRAKKHQLRLTAALGVIVDLDGNIIDSEYMNDLWKPDSELDRLVTSLGLRPPPTPKPAIPPSARRSSKRLKGRGRK